MSEVKIHQLLRSGDVSYFLRPVLRAEPVMGSHFDLVPVWKHATLGLIEWPHVATLAEYIGVDEWRSEQFIARACTYLGDTVEPSGWGPSLTVDVPFRYFATGGQSTTLRRMLLARNIQPSRLRLRFKGASYIGGPTTALKNLMQCREYGVRVAIEGLNDLIGLDRSLALFSPEVGGIGAPYTRAFAAGRNLDELAELIAYARSFGMRVAADAVLTLDAYLSLMLLGFSEFSGPAVGVLMPVPIAGVSSATA